METVFGCGIDVEEISRFDKHVADAFVMEDVCTARELQAPCDDRRLRLALSFSCKEAFFKALGVSWTNSPISWKDIEVLFSGAGVDLPEVHLHDYAEELFKRSGARIGELSFQIDDECVRCEVVLLRTDHGFTPLS